MTSWRDAILKEFVPNVGKLTLVADPDSLLTEEKLALELRKRGFDLIEYNDPVQFRYAYETKYRTIWDKGESTDLVVILRMPEAELDSLPYDLLKAGRKLCFNLGDLFPGLSYPIIEQLDRSLLDDVFEAQNRIKPDALGDNATMDFVLRNVFGIVAEVITTEVELLRALLRLHYNSIQLPGILVERLVDILGSQNIFSQWPLEELFHDQQNFYSFLQERWPIFLNIHARSGHAWEDTGKYGLRYSGPGKLPFDHQDIRIYIDNLFVEGRLTPIKGPDIEAGDDSWFRCGVIEESHNEDIRFNRLLMLVQEELPTEHCRHFDWLSFAMKWAELSALVHGGHQKDDRQKFLEVGRKINDSFSKWLQSSYASLISLSPSSPAMVHHIPRYMARNMEKDKNSRAALVVIDGLSLDQWVTLRRIIQEQDNRIVFHESSVFAWVPTLTSISRQAIFSGKPPIYFPSSIKTTNNEEKLWKQFWEEAGLTRQGVAYQRGLGDGDIRAVLDQAINPGVTRVVGLVVDKVDNIMHGMQLGSSGMHNQIDLWCRQGFLYKMMNYLFDQGYEVWLTSDHGNIECKGKGRPSEGVIAETRGERARIYPALGLRSRAASEFSCAVEWEPVGLPPDNYPLVMDGYGAFVRQDETIVGHGGISIEEVIVPLIKVERSIS